MESLWHAFLGIVALTLMVVVMHMDYEDQVQMEKLAQHPVEVAKWHR